MVYGTRDYVCMYSLRVYIPLFTQRQTLNWKQMDGVERMFIMPRVKEIKVVENKKKKKRKSSLNTASWRHNALRLQNTISVLFPERPNTYYC